MGRMSHWDEEGELWFFSAAVFAADVVFDMYECPFRFLRPCTIAARMKSKNFSQAMIVFFFHCPFLAIAST